jgi:DNA-directed RNA polymerase subunit RPC12/RpoP
MNKYKCNKCGLIVIRDNEKQWFYSYCDSTGILKARLYKQK